MQLLTHHRFTLHFIQHLGQTSVNDLNLSIYFFHRITIQFIVTKMTINCIDNFLNKDR